MCIISEKCCFLLVCASVMSPISRVVHFDTIGVFPYCSIFNIYFGNLGENNEVSSTIIPRRLINHTH